jgi:hypothetical protein
MEVKFLRLGHALYIVHLLGFLRSMVCVFSGC